MVNELTQRHRSLPQCGHWTEISLKPRDSPRVSPRQGIRILDAHPISPPKYSTLGILRGYGCQITAAQLVVTRS